MIKQKRGMGALGWILVILIILLIGGLVAWLFLSGHGSSIISGGGSSIPQPPALPSG
jgi:hypothetical protein